MTPPLIPAHTAAGSPHKVDLWRPVLLRALAALAFGILTIFWARPSAEAMGWAGGLYLLATGLLLLWGVPKAGYPRDGNPGKIFSAAGSALTAAGAAAVLLHGEGVFAVVAALGLSAVGAAELYCGLRYRGRSVLARDWVVSGVVGLGTAASLPFFTGLGAHALLGVAGGGAIISGVLWALSGLSLRHDARASSAKP